MRSVMPEGFKVADEDEERDGDERKGIQRIGNALREQHERQALCVELIEARHVRAAFKTMPVKIDKKDARGHCAVDAAWLVQTGTLQISALGTGTAISPPQQGPFAGTTDGLGRYAISSTR